MLKKLAATFSPIFVLGRGTGDGNSFENAFEVELIPDVLKLYTYNELNKDGITDEVHGNLWYGASSAAASYSVNVEYGFCIKPSSITHAGAIHTTTKWDCL